MSQQQPQRPQPSGQEKPIKYSDVFTVSGDLASKPVTPEDAAMMQTAENLVLGKTQKGGPASVMQSASTFNEKTGQVGHTDVNDVTAEQGVSVAEIQVSGVRIISESVAGQVVGQYVQPQPVPQRSPVSVLENDSVTIGEALEASALTAGEKPVDKSDAAAIQAAEVRATGRNEIMPGGVAAAAQSAANMNERTMKDENKIKLSDVLTDNIAKWPADKAATRQDAEGVAAAEIRNDPNMSTYPGGVAASVASAARLNQNP
ncbi:late embryogenesis abundant protein D-34-like [Telopea speciosissima]|uniref:late embryogenesis abundant protein D-34-like n=1 Tax=Telopea speciosissima TaxID=54955 RepID=UPI001CC7ADA1|nr:late embryogenesis abundant protein D-34-like [Telopea speciosissima]